MANDVRDTQKSPTAVIIFRVVVLFFVLGGIGAAWGTELVRYMNDGLDVTGVDAGWAYLLASACLAVPAALILRHAGNPGGW